MLGVLTAPLSMLSRDAGGAGQGDPNEGHQRRGTSLRWKRRAPKDCRGASAPKLGPIRVPHVVIVKEGDQLSTGSVGTAVPCDRYTGRRKRNTSDLQLPRPLAQFLADTIIDEDDLQHRVGLPPHGRDRCGQIATN